MSQISSAKAALNLPPPIEDDPEQPDRQAQTDALVAINRASTPPAAVNQRRVQRLSIAELNQRDMDDLKARLAKIDDRDRTPLEKVLDLIDLPRNTVANIAVGKPTAGGVAGLIGGPAAAGAAVGALGGPVGAGVGAAVGAGFGAAAGLVGLAGRALGSSGFREDVQKGAAPGGIGAAEQPRIQTSDILRSLGVKNRVVNGLVGFAGDVAFDPITYVGPAGWGTKIVGQKAGQSLILRGAEARGLRRAIAASAKGTAPAARDAHWAEYLASRGLAKAENETADAALDRISRTVMGSQQTGGSALIENVFRPLGGDRVRKGGTLLEDFYAPVVDGPAVAARSAVERSLKGSGPSLKFGLGDDTGVEVLHLPFTDRTVQIPGLTSAVRSTRANQAIARLRDLGAGRAVVESATASEVFSNAVKAADLTQEHSDLSARVAEYTDRIRMMDEGAPLPKRPDQIEPLGSRTNIFPEMVDAAQPPIRPPLTPQRARVSNEITTAFGDESGAILPVIDAFARGWAKAQGKSVDDYYAGLRVEKGGKPGEGALYSIMGWHGSPHKFDKFSTEKIGTGEGAQVYGHGLYFSSKREIAEWYQRTLSHVHNADPYSAKFTKDGRTISGDQVIAEYFKPGSVVPGYGGPDKVLQFDPNGPSGWRVQVARVKPDGTLEQPRWHATAPDKNLDHVMRGHGWERDRGRLFKVELAPNEDELLDWNLPLSQQSPKVIDALKRGGEQFGDFDPDGSSIYDTLAKELGHDKMIGPPGMQYGPAKIKNDAAASAKLKEFGIRGIKYQGRTSDVTNYVIFDDADISIKEMFQRGQSGVAQGSFEMADAGRRIIRSLTNPNASTLPHEVAHDFLTMLPEMDPKLADEAAKALGVDSHAKIGVDQHEAFARGFEAYLRTGEAPSPGLRATFERFRDWLVDLYRSIVGTPLEGKLNPQLKAVFDAMLTQGDSAIHTTPTPAPLIDPAKTALYHAAEQAKRRQQDILDQMTYLVNRQDELLSQVNPADAAQSLTSAQDVLAQVDARRMALDMLDEARSQQWSLQNAANFPHINAMEPEEAAAQIGEDLYHLAINKPDAVLELADLNAKRMKAVQAAANALDAPLSQLLHSDDRQMVNFAKSFIGIDDDAVAVSAFGKIHDALIENWDADAEHALMRRLYATDQWWRNVFGARGGSTARKIAQETARRTNSTDEARRAREALQQQVTTKLADAGIDAGREQLPDAMQYVHMRAHELADPTGGAYHTWEWSDAGPKIGPDGKLTNPSLLRQRIEKLAADGLLVNPAARQALDQIAASIAPAYRQALYAGQDARMLGLGVEGYVGTNKYVDDVQQAIDSLAKETGGSQTGFLGPRSTHQVRYLDPATGKWRRFFAFDQSLIDEFPDPVKVRVPDRFDSAGNPLPPLPADKYAEKTAAEKIREHYKHDGKLASQVAEARDAAIRYNQLAKADPNFAATYPPHPTDPIELNAVAQTGRFDRLTGGKRDVSDFFDSDAGVVVEAYFATAQRAIAKRNMTRLIGDNGFSVNPEHLNNIRNATGRTVPLANGVEATIIPAMKSSLGNEVAAVKIGDTTFRRLDPEVAQKFSAELLGLADQDIQGKLLHPVLADRIEDFAKTFNAHGFEQVLNGLDKINSVWKMATLTHPSWPIFNLVGNSVNAITGGAKPEHMLDPRRWSETFAAIFRPDIEGSITAGGVKYTRKEFLDLAHDLGVRKNNLSLEAAAQFARATPGWSNYTDKHLKWLSAWFRANQNMDDVSRLQAFRSFLDQGFSLEAAAQKTLFAMFDFADFTGIEKNIFKRLIPFYSWMRSNLGYQLNLLMQRPMYAAMAPRLRQSLEDAIAGDSAVPQEMRPSWMRDALAAQIGSDPEGRFGLLLGNGVLPQTDIYNLMLPLVGAEGALKFLHYFTSSLSPTLTTPLQLGAGTEFFSGRSIGADIGADIKPGEFLASQFRPYAEYAPGGKVPRAFAQGTAQGVARALVGGRVQSMDEERVLSSREHELRVTEEKLRSGIRRAERIGDPSASANARAELLALYRKMQRLGFDVPNWAEEQLAPSQESQPIPSPA